jgi:rubrerythrin
MKGEQDKTLEGLRMAIQMEVEGKEYYLQASQNSSNDLGRKLLASLAVEEDTHRQKFEEIYSSIQRERGWPATDFSPDGGKRLRTILALAEGKKEPPVSAPEVELNDIKTAIDMETRTYDFYRSRDKDATYDAERKFYQMVAAEEQEHHLVLLDYYNYLKDPAGWFSVKEHHSLDGG